MSKITRFLPNDEYRAAVDANNPSASNVFATIVDITNADNVKTYANLAAFPVTGIVDAIYVAEDTNLIYRWDGAAYITIGSTDTGITELTGDVTAGPGSGSQVATIGPLKVTNAMLAGSIQNSKLLVDPLDRANHTGTQLLDTISDTNVVSPQLDDRLSWNGTAWVNSPTVAVAGGSGGVRLYKASPIINVVDAENDNLLGTLSKTPVLTPEQVISTAVNNNTVIANTWLNGTLNRTLIDAGTWVFETYTAVDTVASGRVSTLTQIMYIAQTESGGVTITATGSGTSRTITASGGTPFATTKITANATNTLASYLNTPKGVYQITARASDTSITILVPTGYVNEAAVAFTSWKKLFDITSPVITSIAPDYVRVEHSSTQPSFTIALTDKIAMITFATSNNITTVTTTYDGERSPVVTIPLVTLHNEIAGLQGGAGNEFYHLTAAEYSKMLTQDGVKVSATASGVDTYTAAMSPAITSYLDTHRFFIKFTNANTGATTIDINGVGVKALVKNGSEPLVAGDISAGQIYGIAYDGTNFQILGKIVTDTGITQLTGDVTAGPGSGSQVTTISDNSVTNAKLADVPTATFKGRTTAATGDPEDLTITQAKTLLNLTGTNSGDQTITLTGDVTGSGTGSFPTTIGANTVTNTKLAQMPANTVKVNATGSLANAQDLAMPPSTFLARLASGDIVAATVAQAKTLIGLFTSVLSGLVPASGGGTINFLRADGTWAPVASIDAIETTSLSTFNLNSTHSTLLADTVLAPITVNLPDATLNTGRKYAIKKISADANTVTVAAFGAQTIEFATTQILAFRGDVINVQSDGSNWILWS